MNDRASYQKQFKEFTETKIRPHAHAWDEKKHFPREVFNALAEKRWHSMTYSKDLGGLGLPYSHYYDFIETLGRGTLAFSVCVGVTNLVQGAIYQFGNKDQKEKYLRPLIEGRYLGAFSLSEPQSGSDAAALTTTAKKVSGGYSVSGMKSWCSNAGEADVYLLMARTGEHRTKGISAFLVPAKTQGFTIGKSEKKLGLHADPLAQLIFDNAFIPQENLLGSEGEGFKVALSQLDAGRINIGVAGIAICEETLSTAWKEIQNQPESDGIKQLLAGYYAEIGAARALLNQAIEKKEREEPITIIASQLKLFASDLAMKISSEVITCLGPKGVSTNYTWERFFRDAKALQIVEGTNQIQRLVLARHLDETYL